MDNLTPAETYVLQYVSNWNARIGQPCPRAAVLRAAGMVFRPERVVVAALHSLVVVRKLLVTMRNENDVTVGYEVVNNG